jgi:YihY family inner membrane protein
MKEMEAVLASARAGIGRLYRRLPDHLRRVVERVREDDIFLLGAGLAFYALVSLPPLVILVLWITSLAVGDDRVEQLAEQFRRFAPEELGAEVALEQVAETGTGLGIVALLTALWPATAYGSALARSFQRLSPGSDRPMRGIRGRGLVLVVLLPLFVFGSLVASLAGTLILQDRPVVGFVLALATGFAGAVAAVILIFWAFSPRPLGRRRIWRGAAWAATGISLLSLAFTAYLVAGANFEEHYAVSSLIGVVVLAIWLFVANIILLLAYALALES